MTSQRAIHRRLYWRDIQCALNKHKVHPREQRFTDESALDVVHSPLTIEEKADYRSRHPTSDGWQLYYNTIRKGIQKESLEAVKANAAPEDRFRKRPKPSNRVAQASQMNARPSRRPVAKHNGDSTKLGSRSRGAGNREYGSRLSGLHSFTNANFLVRRWRRTRRWSNRRMRSSYAPLWWAVYDSTKFHWVLMGAGWAGWAGPGLRKWGFSRFLIPMKLISYGPPRCRGSPEWIMKQTRTLVLGNRGKAFY